MANLQDQVKRKLEDRARAKRDKMFLANDVLGYEFQECHRELFDLYPAFDENKPWADQIKGFEDIMVLWPRGHYKSTALIVIIIQAILNNPDITILLLRGSIAVTQLFFNEIKSHFMGEASGSRLQDLFPEFCGTKRELGDKPAQQFTVPCRKRKQTPQATCTVASPKAIKTSQHYDLGIFDDMQNESNSASPRLTEKVKADFVACQPLVQHGGRWVSGTRWAFGDLYEQILRWNKNDSWVVSIKDCWLRDKDGVIVDVRFPKYLKKNNEWGGFDKQKLLLLQAQNAAWFSCQYLNNPIAESLRNITEAEMEAACILEALAPALSTPCFFIDLAGEGHVAPDDSVILVGKVASTGVPYLVDGRGGTWNIPQLTANLIDMALRHRPLKIFIEETASAKYFVEYVRMVCRDQGVNLPLDYIKVDTRHDAKTIRIQAMSGHVRGGRLKFFIGLPIWKKLVEQTTNYPKAEYGHDDYPDTLALMCNVFSKTYLSLPGPSLLRTQNPMIQRLDRDPVMMTGPSAMAVDQEILVRDSSMGDEFAC